MDEDGGAVVEGGHLDAPASSETGHDVGEEAGDSVGAADGVAGGGLHLGAAVEDELDVGDQRCEEGVEVAAFAGGDEASHDFVPLGWSRPRRFVCPSSRRCRARRSSWRHDASLRSSIAAISAWV